MEKIKNYFLKIIFLITLILFFSVAIYQYGFLIFTKFLSLYLLIMSISVNLSIILKKNINCTIPITFFVIIIILYIFGLLHLLKYGIVFIIVVAVISLINVCKHTFNKKNSNCIINVFQNIGFYIFSLLFFGLLITTKNAAFTVWDEYSFWSIASKNMYYLNDFYTNEQTTLWATFYPPCPTILQYFFSKFVGTYNQGNELFVFQILGFSMFLPFLKNVNKKKIISIICIVFCIICLPAIFVDSTFYYTIYADSLLGIMVGYILFEYFTTENSKYKYLFLFTSIFCLTMTKATGVIFASILMLIMILYNFKFKLDNNKKLCLTVVSSIIMSKVSWLIHCALSKTIYNGGYINEMTYYDGNPIIYVLKLIFKTVLGINSEGVNTTFQTFFRDFFDKSYYVSKPFELSSSSIISIFIIIFIVVYSIVINKKEKNKFKSFSILISIGSILYIIFLQLSYSLFFSRNEAIHHVSLQRYAGSMYFAILVFIIGIIFYNFNKSNISNKFYILVSAIILIFTPIYSISNATISSGIYNYQNQKTLEPVKVFADFIRSKTKSDDKILCIHQQQANNANLLIFRYFMTPQLIIMTNQITENTSGMFLSINNSETFENLLYNEFNYLVILETDNYFNDNYSKYFDNKIDNWSLYKIDKDNLKLYKIEEV